MCGYDGQDESQHREFRGVCFIYAIQCQLEIGNITSVNIVKLHLIYCFWCDYWLLIANVTFAHRNEKLAKHLFIKNCMQIFIRMLCVRLRGVTCNGHWRTLCDGVQCISGHFKLNFLIHIVDIRFVQRLNVMAFSLEDQMINLDLEQMQKEEEEEEDLFKYCKLFLAKIILLDMKNEDKEN
ncbi:hypothetical protein T10_7460 [Trichinella papuae]|uniref:Uncharacterized protein n=1 Tax=Trichinella papuae TaxID=268474 RepID=A0A0V1MQH0_9BILA|nr:hypothetical protein T10_7460 [Trichinella papuae]